MIENYQDERAVEEESEFEPDGQNFATIGEVYDDGVSLVFDGAAGAGNKHYKVNTSVVFNAGDRVKIIKDSGTYVVEYAVGAPLTERYADKAGSAESAKTAETAEKAKNVTETINDKSITDIFESNGLRAKNATNVTSKINDKNITEIFEADGTTVKKATAVDGAKKIFAGAGTLYYVELTGSYEFIPSNSSLAFKIGNTSNWWTDAYIKNLHLGGNNMYEIIINASRELKPDSYSTSYPCYLGTSSAPWHYAYLGSNTILIGTAAAAKLVFFGATPIARQTLSLSSNDMSYSNVTASNYLTALNNLIGILKNKYGLIY